jgi:putative hemolysin
MINIEKEITKKFPTLSCKSPMIKKSLFKIAQKIVHEDKINDFLETNKHLVGFDFVEAVLDYFKFDFSYSSNDIENIPSTGRVVIISNHPLGALDALCLLKLISKVRKDVKIVANDFLADFESMDSLFIKVDNFKSKQSKNAIKQVYKALESEEVVVMFPAGEVSRISPTGVKDGLWKKGFLKFAKKTKSPILPILVDAKNSKLFYTLSILNKTFSTILLSDEMFKQKDKNVNIKIGKIISNEDIIPKGIDESSLVKLYKKHLYNLKKGKKTFLHTKNAIAHSDNIQLIKKELKQSEILGKTNDGKIIYLYNYSPDSLILNEIGRLREISFRKVNEGVNKKRDTDKYDKYYQHIILWDEEDLEIVGAYRIGNSKEIYEKYGFDGFYSHTLFKFQKNFIPYMENSIELGRSFVQPKYWGTRALDYLWFGIGAYLRRHRDIKYMYGPVSLSSSLPPIAQDLIVGFYSHYFFPKKKLVQEIDKFKYNFEHEDELSICPEQNYKDDLKLLKNSLKSIDSCIPTLYKQYSDLCENGGVTFHGFNVDVNFSNCIDGFIVVEIEKIKESKKTRYIR